MIKTTPSRIVILAILLFTLTLAGACNRSTPTPEPTNTPVPPTDTPIPPTETPTEVPTNTPTLTFTPSETPTETSTPTETPTETPDLPATAAIEATQAAEQAMQLVGAELEKVGISTDNGYLAWAEEGPTPVFAYTYGTLNYLPIDEGEVYETYVLYTDITWESTSGVAGCGFIFHAEDNIQRGEQYLFQTLKLSGLPLWDVELWNNGQQQAITTGDAKVNSAIDQDDGSTNTYVMVVKDGLITLYANDSRLSNVITSSRNRGRIAFIAWQESGETICTFENSWIWAFEEE